jgi:hypothetical protein
MICDFCQKDTNQFFTLSYFHFCTKCLQDNKIVECPGQNCDQILSLNDNNNQVNIDDNKCSMCRQIMCNNCIKLYKNIKICNNCISYNQE